MFEKQDVSVWTPHSQSILVCARLIARYFLPHQRWGMVLSILLASPKPRPQECQVWCGRVGKEIPGQLLMLTPNTKPPDAQMAFAVYNLTSTDTLCTRARDPNTAVQMGFSFLSDIFSFLCASFGALLSILFLIPKYPLVSFLSP